MSGVCYIRRDFYYLKGTNFENIAGLMPMCFCWNIRILFLGCRHLFTLFFRQYRYIAFNVPLLLYKCKLYTLFAE